MRPSVVALLSILVVAALLVATHARATGQLLARGDARVQGSSLADERRTPGSRQLLQVAGNDNEEEDSAPPATTTTSDSSSDLATGTADDIASASEEEEEDSASTITTNLDSVADPLATQTSAPPPTAQTTATPTTQEDCDSILSGSSQFLGECECPIGEINIGAGACSDCASIKPGSALVGDACVCPGNLVDNGAGACVDNCESILSGSTASPFGRCVCDPSATARAGACVPCTSILTGSTSTNSRGECICDDPWKFNNRAGACVPCADILSGSTLVEDECKCPDGEIDNGAGACVSCSDILSGSTTSDFFGRCVCDDPSEVDNGAGVCVPCASILTGSTARNFLLNCQCDDPLKFDNDSGVCVPCESELTGSISPPSDGTCQCPGDLVDNGAGACIDDCDSILPGFSLVEGVCECPGDLVEIEWACGKPCECNFDIRQVKCFADGVEVPEKLQPKLVGTCELQGARIDYDRIFYEFDAPCQGSQFVVEIFPCTNDLSEVLSPPFDSLPRDAIAPSIVEEIQKSKNEVNSRLRSELESPRFPVPVEDPPSDGQPPATCDCSFDREGIREGDFGVGRDDFYNGKCLTANGEEVKGQVVERFFSGWERCCGEISFIPDPPCSGKKFITNICQCGVSFDEVAKQFESRDFETGRNINNVFKREKLKGLLGSQSCVEAEANATKPCEEEDPIDIIRGRISG